MHISSCDKVSKDSGSATYWWQKALHRHRDVHAPSWVRKFDLYHWIKHFAGACRIPNKIISYLQKCIKTRHVILSRHSANLVIQVQAVTQNMLVSRDYDSAKTGSDQLTKRRECEKHFIQDASQSPHVQTERGWCISIWFWCYVAQGACCLWHVFQLPDINCKTDCKHWVRWRCRWQEIKGAVIFVVKYER